MLPSTVTSVPSTPPDTIWAVSNLYCPFSCFLVTSIFNVSNILLYPSGAFVSFIVIVSLFSTSVISTVPKFAIPFSFVVTCVVSRRF